MQAIDVVMLTKNSEHLLNRCLDSIYQNVPVKNLIVVDGFSTDRTLKIFQAYNKRYGNITILSMNGSRAKAREKGIARVTTDWFLFADSDVILSRDWFRRAQKDIQHDVGAVWGVNVDVIPNMKDTRVLKLQILVASRGFKLRGGTHDVLLRRDLVSDIKIPGHLHTYEDAYIMSWIRHKGYKTVIGQDIFCLHFKPSTNWNFTNLFNNALLEARCGLVYFHNFAYAVYYPFFTAFWLLQIAIRSVLKLAPA